MKKLLLLTALVIAGVASANQPMLQDDQFTKEVTVVEIPECVGVESDCGEGGIWYACGEPNATEGELDHEIVDEMRQQLNEAFCGY